VIVTEHDIESLTHYRRLIDSISHGVSAAVGEDFFQQLTLQLCTVFGTSHALVGVIDNETKHRVETLALCHDGQIVDNLSYTLAGTPCENVTQQNLCLYREGVQELFPHDDDLVKWGVESYVGTPLKDSHNHTIGIIAVMDFKPMDARLPIAEIVRIFASRASAELERMRAHRQLFKAQQRLALHVENTPLAVIEWNRNHQIEDWNPAAEAIFGYSKAEVMGRSADFLFGTDESQAQHFNTGLKHVSTHKRVSTLHVENQAKNGGIIACTWYHSPLLTHDDEVIGISSFVADQTAERDALREVSLREHEQREILDSLVDAVITINESGDILTFNQSAERMFGYASNEVVGKNVQLLMPEDVARYHDGYIQHYLDTGETRIIGRGREVEALDRSGNRIPVHLSISELPNHNGEGRRFVGCCHDLSELKKRDDQLRRSQKMDSLGKLTGGIAHDFNNILGVITGYVEMLSGQLENGSKEKRYADEIKRASRRGASLTQKLLAFSRGRAGSRRTVDINLIIKENKSLLQQSLTPRIRMKTDLQGSVWTALLDEGELVDALLNLTINATHAIGADEGTITLRTRNLNLDPQAAELRQLRAGDYICLSVSDTGHGLSEAECARIFEPFYTTKGDLGSGLGLSQVYGFVQRSDGVINVDSRLGQGSRFELYFPRCLSEQQELTEAASSDDLSATHAERIMVVDDEEALAQLCAELLRDAGYQVQVANSAATCLDQMKRQAFDLVITDIVMPETDGFELAKAIKEHYPATTIQFMSGYDDGRVEEQGETFDAVLRKPFSPYVLLKRVSSRLARQSNPDK